MSDPAWPESQKRAAAEAAVKEIRDGMIVGLGTGSTAAFAISAVGQMVRDGLRIRAVATSDHTAAAARAAGIDIIDLAPLARIDLAIDGVDEIDAAFRAIKGAGGAMLRERIVAEAADRMIAIADASKPVVTLGARHPVPLEIAAMAQGLVHDRIGRLGGEAVLRVDAAGAAIRSDTGNPILDCMFGPIPDPAGLATALSAIPGVFAHGLFLIEVDALYIGTETTVERRDRR